jgi:ABC-type glycerol-3-phosphate transport system substrate-binding protein
MPKRFPISIFLAAVTLAAAACSGGDSSEVTTLPTTPATTTTVVETTTSTAETTTTTMTATSTTTTIGDVTVVIAVSYADGEVDGPEQSEVAQGSLVQILVTSDVKDEVRLEGYDIKADVAPDTAALLEFVADTTGTFDLELYDEEVILLEIEVL